ncbi:hypothetical protein R1sor_006230 [Riccia sorocarpa]|uniref:Reverse transcriptase domain-containing protein n=1 Tax=Riccia sorocarpa TaxID=122646 RepID=A0ABD3HQG4_9MARC
MKGIPHAVSIATEDHNKTAFITPWSAYAYSRIPFGLNGAPATFQRLVIETFSEYIGDFMEAFLDDFTVYGPDKKHLEQLEKALVRSPVNSLNKDDVPYEWTKRCDEAFSLLKEKMTQGPILRPPRWDMPFHIHTDASGVAVGVVLAQPQDPKLDLPIYFASRTLNKNERDYTTTEREALAMEFDFTVVYKPSKLNVVADQLSRLELGREPGYEDDSFPDEHLLSITLDVPDDHPASGRESEGLEKAVPSYTKLLKGGWQSPLRYFLANGELPKDTPYHLKRRITEKIK